MSQCIPYPQPGYVRNGTSGGEVMALIDFIKIERAIENSRKDRKKEKREKEEKSKHKSIGNNPDGFQRKLDFVGVDGKLKDGKKNVKDEVEQLEKSDITEELGQAAPSESLCYTSDGSTKKRKRNPASSETASIRKEGNIIRIMLPLKKHKEPIVTSAPATCFDWIQARKEAVTIKDIQLPLPASTGFRPLAHFLPQANIYALPYTVPF